MTPSTACATPASSTATSWAALGSSSPGNTVYRAQFVKMICGAAHLTVAENDWPDPSVPFIDLESEVDLQPGPGVVDSLYPHEYVACRLPQPDHQWTDAHQLRCYMPASNGRRW